MYPDQSGAKGKKIDFFDGAAPGVEFIGGGVTRV